MLLLNLIAVHIHTGREFSIKENLAKNFCILRIRLRSRDSSVIKATGLKARVRVPVGESFSLLHIIFIGSVAHPASCSMGTGTISTGVNRPGGEADHSPPSNARGQYLHSLIWLHGIVVN
jgi:hypothetical protein